MWTIPFSGSFFSPARCFFFLELESLRFSKKKMFCIATAAFVFLALSHSQVVISTCKLGSLPLICARGFPPFSRRLDACYDRSIKRYTAFWLARFRKDGDPQRQNRRKIGHFVFLHDTLVVYLARPWDWFIRYRYIGTFILFVPNQFFWGVVLSSQFRGTPFRKKKN